MKMGFDLEEFQPIFGEAKPEFVTSATSNGDGVTALNPFLFRVFAVDSSHLAFHVTDFRSYTWEALRSVHQLDDMRDSIGIGGSCSDFMNYVIASFTSKDVKLIMDWQPKLSGVTSAKLIARKTKGMPLISISLTKLGPSSASGAVANMSLELYRAYNILQESFVKEQERCCQLTQMISAEKEKSQAVKRKLDMMQSDQQRLQKTTGSGNVVFPMYSDTASVTAALNSSDKQAVAEAKSAKVVHRVVPAYRRAKNRGAVLCDTEEEEKS
ncbi:uncharacterized protein LOC110695168 [Chenopodium quinoa]|uniref:uncharacterized protein LOC110694060 n=1 Tax=Chenopodium quinoa TaxID=63459 RepID=UPI000B79919C|nr:uncharacterized protein LOC110694060 [Chenopodium quinoa]XP_021728077.1 uncharacterized protein LOC110695168 [Chenopodium quinoa]